MNKSLTVLVVVCALVLGIGIGFNIQLVSYPISSMATIKTLGVTVWQDVNLTIPLTLVDWGLIEPNQTKTLTCWVRNEGNSPLTLSLWTENWQPTNATNYISLSWNLEGEVVEVGEALEANLTLTVSPSIENITSFSFDIVISGSG